MTDYLEVADLLTLAERQAGEALVRDHGLLESAVARPQASAYGEDAYPDLIVKAAALLHSLCTNHAMVDGNKRLAVGAAELFLALNGVELDATDDELYDLTMDVANGECRDVEEIGKRLRLLVSPRRGGQGG